MRYLNRQQRRKLQRIEEKKRRASNPASNTSASRHQPAAVSPSPDRPADKITTIERFDPRAGLRNKLRDIAVEKGEWAGIPMPIEEIPLIIEPNYPNGQELAKIGQTDKEPLPDGIAERNTFYSHHARCDIVIWNEPDGRIRHGYVPAFHSLGHALSTLGASAAAMSRCYGAAPINMHLIARRPDYEIRRHSRDL